MRNPNHPLNSLFFLEQLYRNEPTEFSSRPAPQLFQLPDTSQLFQFRDSIINQLDETLGRINKPEKSLQPIENFTQQKPFLNQGANKQNDSQLVETNSKDTVVNGLNPQEISGFSSALIQHVKRGFGDISIKPGDLANQISNEGDTLAKDFGERVTKTAESVSSGAQEFAKDVGVRDAETAESVSSGTIKFAQTVSDFATINTSKDSATNSTKISSIPTSRSTSNVSLNTNRSESSRSTTSLKSDIETGQKPKDESNTNNTAKPSLFSRIRSYTRRSSRKGVPESESRKDSEKNSYFSGTSKYLNSCYTSLSAWWNRSREEQGEIKRSRENERQEIKEKPPERRIEPENSQKSSFSFSFSLPRPSSIFPKSTTFSLFKDQELQGEVTIPWSTPPGPSISDRVSSLGKSIKKSISRSYSRTTEYLSSESSVDLRGAASDAGQSASRFASGIQEGLLSTYAQLKDNYSNRERGSTNYSETFRDASRSAKGFARGIQEGLSSTYAQLKDNYSNRERGSTNYSETFRDASRSAKEFASGLSDNIRDVYRFAKDATNNAQAPSMPSMRSIPSPNISRAVADIDWISAGRNASYRAENALRSAKSGISSRLSNLRRSASQYSVEVTGNWR